MNNYPQTRQSSDLQSYTHNHYEQPQVSFFDGLKRLGWVVIVLAIWGVCGFFYSAYQANAEKWNSLAFCVAVVAFIFLLMFFAAMLAQLWAERAGVSFIKKADIEPMTVQSEYQHEREKEEIEKPIFARRLLKENTPEYDKAVYAHYLAMKDYGNYSKSLMCFDVFGEGKKGSFYEEKLQLILDDYGVEL